jgi:Rrf2 family protein
MKLITRETDYAIRTIRCVVESNMGLVTVRELEKCLDMPRPFLRKILQALNKKGIFESFKGKGGGFKLSLPPEKISLIDVIETFQGKFSMNDHTFRGAGCPMIKNCKLKNKIDGIEKKVYDELKSITIKDVSK